MSLKTFVKSLSAVAVMAVAASSAQAQTQTIWRTTAPVDGLDWTTASNWVDVVPGINNDAIFSGGSGSRTTNPATTTQIVNQNFTVNSLRAGFDSGATNPVEWSVIQIPDAITLSITTAGTKPTTSTPGTFVVGAAERRNIGRVTHARFFGEGTLDVGTGSESGLLFVVRSDGSDNASANPDARAVLDMGDLENFNMNWSGTGTAMNIGSTGATSGSNPHLMVPVGNVTMANNSFIKAETLRIGSSQEDLGINRTGKVSTLLLGPDAELYFNSILIGAAPSTTTATVRNRNNGLLGMRDDVVDGTVVIRAQNETGRVENVWVATTGLAFSAAQGAIGTIDFRDATVDAAFENLILGSGSVDSTSSSYSIGVDARFYMDAGEVDSFDVLLAESLANAGANAGGQISGLIDVSGGTFTTGGLTMSRNTGGPNQVSSTLNISNGGEVRVLARTQNMSTSSGSIVMGDRTGTSNNIQAHIDIDGGSLHVEGDIIGGGDDATTVSRTITLDGNGSLDMNGGSITGIDALNLINGTLANLGEFNSGADVIKSTAGTLILDGVNLYSGNTIVEAGTVELAGTLGNGNVLVEDGAVFTLLNSGQLRFNIVDDLVADEFVADAGSSVAFDGTLVFNLAQPFSNGSWGLFSGTVAADFLDLSGVSISGALAGTLTNIGGGLWEGDVSGRTFTFDVGTGTLSVIPEPSAAMLLTGAGLLWLLRRRARRN